ncbi:MAG TPA: DUF3853 family protein [Bacteroidaceae bacterium]|nr:DUF3853 family protein [Bacteroidaceae bacterium]
MERKIEIKDKPLLQATLEDFWQVGIEMGLVVPNVANESNPKLILGIKALAQELGISVSSINRLISQGTLDSAIYQSGKLVWFDLREVLNLMKKDRKK